IGSIVEVDKARHLYDLENQTARVAATEITTPEAARSLLDQILEQLNRAPEQAMKSQASGETAPLANLLQTAPA
ncbi:MAG: ribosome maturation factor rimM, partial [Candidatus Thiodiazotropha sp.]